MTTAALEVHTTGMLALIPSAESAQNLLVDGGDDLDQLHVTLVYLGEAADLNPEQRAAILTHVQGLHQGEFEGNIFGRAEFNPGEGAAQVYMVGGNPIETLRDELKVYNKSEYAPYVAHLTAGYGVSLDSLTYTGPVTFDRIRVAFGDEVTDVHLMKEEDMSKEALTRTAEWLQSNGDGHDAVYTHIDFPYIAVVQTDEDPDETDSFYAYWEIMDNDTMAVHLQGRERTVDEAQLTAEAAIASLRGVGITSAVKESATSPAYNAGWKASGDEKWDSYEDAEAAYMSRSRTREEISDWGDGWEAYAAGWEKGQNFRQSAVKTAWAFSDETQSYVATGEKPDFQCECGTKVALADSVNECPTCKTSWHTWSVQGSSKTAAPTKHFVRTVMKRDNVILAANKAMIEASSNSFGDRDHPTVNDVEIDVNNYYSVDGEMMLCDGAGNESDNSAYADFIKADGSTLHVQGDDLFSYTIDYADDELHFTSGYEFALEGNSFASNKFSSRFSESFREGYIAQLNEQLDNIRK